MTSDRVDNDQRRPTWNVYNERDGRGRYQRTLAGAARDAEAARQRARGRTFQQIATDLSLGSRQAAYKAVERGLGEVEEAGRDEARALMVAHLDELAAEALAVLDTDHVVVSQGRVVDRDGAPLRDDGPRLAAIDRLLKIADRRARLLGLDAPLQIGGSVSDLDAAVAELEVELRVRAGDEPVPNE